MIVSVDIPWIPWPGTRAVAGGVVALLRAVCEAHYRSARDNENISSTVVRTVRAGNPDSPLAPIAAALLSSGRVHGPIDGARRVWRMSDDELVALRDSGAVVPGFGNSFFKEGPDPAWQGVIEVLGSYFPSDLTRLEGKTRIMQEKSRRLWPNPGGFTAVASEIAGIPEGRENVLVLLGRIPSWMDLP